METREPADTGIVQDKLAKEMIAVYDAAYLRHRKLQVGAIAAELAAMKEVIAALSAAPPVPQDLRINDGLFGLHIEPMQPDQPLETYVGMYIEVDGFEAWIASSMEAANAKVKREVVLRIGGVEHHMTAREFVERVTGGRQMEYASRNDGTSV